MGVYDAPQWLLPAFVRSVQAVGGTADPDEIRTVGEALIDRWSSPERRFHNLKHLVAVLARVDELTEETHEPDAVRLAAWYHGIVFEAGVAAQRANKAGEDETASADVAESQLVALGVPQACAHRVHEMLVHLARHTPDPADPDTAVLCDADLGMLAVEPQRYKAYVEDLRAEYAHVAPLDFLRARRHILRKLLARPSLFLSPLSERWEEPARQNVTAELARVEKELAKLEAQQAAGAPEPGTDEAAAPADGARPGETPTRPTVTVIPKSVAGTGR